MSSLIIGTRGSELALWQANHVKQLLEKHGVESTIKIIKTKGDQIQHLSFDKIEGKGFFTKELEEALLSNEIDFAVHSHKDLPTSMDERLVIASIPQREDNTETLIVNPRKVNKTFFFPVVEGGVIGTSSARRKSQIKLFSDNYILKDIRGNVPTRISKLRNGEFDAIMLATAGLKRLNIDLSGLSVFRLPIEHFVSAPAQGALAIQCRKEDEKTIKALNKLSEDTVLEDVENERAILALLDGGCQLPFGASIINIRDSKQIKIAFSHSSDKAPIRLSLSFNSTKDELNSLVSKLKSDIDKSIFISSAADEKKMLFQSIKDNFSEFSFNSLIHTENRKLQDLPLAEWIFFNSRNAINSFIENNFSIDIYKVACFGESTSMYARNFFKEIHFYGKGESPETIAEDFIKTCNPISVLFLGSDQSEKSIYNLLPERITKYFVSCYKTSFKANIQMQNQDILVFTSPMNLKSYLNKYSINQFGLLETIYKVAYNLEK